MGRPRRICKTLGKTVHRSQKTQITTKIRSSHRIRRFGSHASSLKAMSKNSIRLHVALANLAKPTGIINPIFRMHPASSLGSSWAPGPSLLSANAGCIVSPEFMHKRSEGPARAAYFFLGAFGRRIGCRDLFPSHSSHFHSSPPPRW